MAAASPEAATAGARVLAAGGSAVDAAIAAQAVIAVVLPQAAGLGGDLLALVHHHGAVEAVNGTGRSPHLLAGPPTSTGGLSVTVPGLVDGWLVLHQRWGRLPLPSVLAPAIELAEAGIEVGADLRASVEAQLPRLYAGGAAEWELLTGLAADPTAGWRQPALAEVLAGIATEGRAGFYSGRVAAAIVDAVRRQGGVLDHRDLTEHDTMTPAPVAQAWEGGTAYVQPPASQGVLLAMALRKVAALRAEGVPIDDHALIEIVGAAFAHRSNCGIGADLLGVPLEIDLHRASGRSGPRAYLHTAGVAVADADGQVVSSLISVFDDFGSGVFVPELGAVLNNRAAGFTDGANSPAPAKRPVHTLAPALVVGDGGVTALATPGADGQIQTLLQVLTAARERELADAVTAPRWRSEDGRLLIENDHPAAEDLAARGHRIEARNPGEDVFGAVVAAGFAGQPFAVADWRRQTHCAGVP